MKLKFRPIFIVHKYWDLKNRNMRIFTFAGLDARSGCWKIEDTLLSRPIITYWSAQTPITCRNLWLRLNKHIDFIFYLILNHGSPPLKGVVLEASTLITLGKLKSPPSQNFIEHPKQQKNFPFYSLQHCNSVQILSKTAGYGKYLHHPMVCIIPEKGQTAYTVCT